MNVEINRKKLDSCQNLAVSVIFPSINEMKEGQINFMISVCTILTTVNIVIGLTFYE